VEKHVPVVTVEGNKVTVTVGSVEHPMAPEHYIEWIALETAKGSQRKTLKPGEPPCAEFILSDDDSCVAAYAYCNLHGLWKS
jgi:superoxide reductase